MALSSFHNLNLGLPETLGLDTLESRRFGLPISRLNLWVSERDSNDLASSLHCAEIIDKFRESDSELLILRYPAHLVGWASRLLHEDITLLPADTLVYYYQSIIDLDSPTRTAHGQNSADSSDWYQRARPVTSDDLEYLTNFVRSTFRAYPSHYHANPLFSSSDQLEGYVEWTERVVGFNNHRVMWLVDESQAIVAFFFLRIDTVNEERLVQTLQTDLGTTFAELVLGGIAPSARGRGIYPQIIAVSERVARENGAIGMTISTQIWNKPVQRTWTRRGYALIDSFHTVHLLKGETRERFHYLVH